MYVPYLAQQTFLEHLWILQSSLLSLTGSIIFGKSSGLSICTHMRLGQVISVSSVFLGYVACRLKWLLKSFKLKTI